MNEREKLKSEFARLRRLVKIGARILLLGLGVEIIVLLIFSQGKPWCETASFILSVVAVIIGVWIEESAGSQAEDVTEELQRLSDEEIARSTERAAEANQKAEEARLELARFRAPRVLNDKQIERIANELRRFADIEFDIGVGPGDPEFIGLAMLIERCLRDAHWRGIDFRGSTAIWSSTSRSDGPSIGTDVTAVGVIVGLSRPDEEIPAIADAALALANALEAEGIASMYTWVPWVSPPNESAVHIRIGRKP